MNAVNDNLSNSFDQQMNDVEKVNLMIVGGTGVGKSSLLNTVFKKDIARVGSGEPITRGCHKYSDENIPVNIFDTEGYEIKGSDIDNSNFQKNVISEIDRLEKMDLKDQIHVFWYCISVATHRITSYDIDNIKQLNRRNVKLAIVFTQCDSDELDDNDEGVVSKEYKDVLYREGIKNSVFETMCTQDENHLDLDKLIEWSAKELPSDQLKAAFIGAQKSNIGLKDKEADRIILALSSTVAASVGANPIPLSDSLIIMPQQIALAVKLSKIYGFNTLGGNIMSLLKTQLLSLLGKQLASSLIKFIPILGQAINAAVAGGLTLALGFALKNIYRKAYLEYLDTGKVPNWAELFSSLDISDIISHASKAAKDIINSKK